MSDERIQPGQEEQRSLGQLVFYDKARWTVEKDNLIPILTKITTDALGETPRDMTEVADEWEEVIVVREGTRIVGYAGYTAHDISGVGKILYESGKMVAKEAQGNGYGGILTREALAHHTDANYLAFSSQNPAEIQSVRRALEGRRLAPIDVGYGEDEGLRTAMRRFVETTGRKDINADTGLWRQVYGDERFGDYSINMSKPDIRFIEERLALLGFDRDAGDGVIFMSRLKSLEPARRSGLSELRATVGKTLRRLWPL